MYSLQQCNKSGVMEIDAWVRELMFSWVLLGSGRGLTYLDLCTPSQYTRTDTEELSLRQSQIRLGSCHKSLSGHVRHHDRFCE